MPASVLSARPEWKREPPGAVDGQRAPFADPYRRMTAVLVTLAVLLGLPGLAAAAHLGVLLALASLFYREPRPADEPTALPGAGARRTTRSW